MRNFLRFLERIFRNTLVYPIARMVLRNPVTDQTISLGSVRKILILRYDRIGDMIVTTPVFRRLKHINPDLYLGVFAGPANAEIVRFDPSVDRIHVLSPNPFVLLRDILAARKENYDVVLNFIFNRTTTGGILANLIAPRGIKIGQGAEKYRFWFNRFLTLKRASNHMVEILASYVEEVFGIEFSEEELRFEICVDDGARRSVDTFLSARSLSRRGDSAAGASQYVALNLSATDQVRQMSSAQVLALARFLSEVRGLPTILLSAPGDAGLRKHIARAAGGGRIHSFPESGPGNLRELASLIGGASCVFTPDTSVIHFAAAMHTPVMGLFTPLQETAEWLPFGVEYLALHAPAGTPVSGIPNDTIVKKAEEFLHILQTSGA